MLSYCVLSLTYISSRLIKTPPIFLVRAKNLFSLPVQKLIIRTNLFSPSLSAHRTIFRCSSRTKNQENLPPRPKYFFSPFPPFCPLYTTRTCPLRHINPLPTAQIVSSHTHLAILYCAGPFGPRTTPLFRSSRVSCI